MELIQKLKTIFCNHFWQMTETGKDWVIMGCEKCGKTRFEKTF